MATVRPDLTIIMVSYNTRDLTLAAIRTCLETTRQTAFRLVVLDNASSDGSADAIAEAFPPDRFPQIELVRSDENLGFAMANNVVARTAETEFLLLLNPDTECHEGAVDNLMRFARETPEAGIWGGRTTFPDGRLNPGSCWMRITPWSTLCWATGLTGLLPDTHLFNPEGLGGWSRDTERAVDIVSGCFFLVRRDLWDRLGGFDRSYFMYGEEADLCLRARALGAGPRITPTAHIMHIAGASSPLQSAKRQLVLKARVTLMRRHWPAWQIPIGIALVRSGVAARYLATQVLSRLTGSDGWSRRAAVQSDIWQARQDWLAGY